MAMVVAGIDVSKKSLNIHLNGKDETATNDTDGFRKIAGILKDGGAERVVMEATGRMHRALLQSLHDRGLRGLCGQPPPVPGLREGRRRAGEDRQGRRQDPGRLRGRVPGHAGHRACRRDQSTGSATCWCFGRPLSTSARS